jgi:hypothetical protein
MYLQVIEQKFKCFVNNMFFFWKWKGEKLFEFYLLSFDQKQNSYIGLVKNTLHVHNCVDYVKQKTTDNYEDPV